MFRTINNKHAGREKNNCTESNLFVFPSCFLGRLTDSDGRPVGRSLYLLLLCVIFHRYYNYDYDNCMSFQVNE